MAGTIEISSSQDCVRVLREMADRIEAGQIPFAQAVNVVHSKPEGPYDMRYLGTTVVLTTFPFPVDENKLKDLIERG